TALVCRTSNAIIVIDDKILAEFGEGTPKELKALTKKLKSKKNQYQYIRTSENSFFEGIACNVNGHYTCKLAVFDASNIKFSKEQREVILSLVDQLKRLLSNISPGLSSDGLKTNISQAAIKKSKDDLLTTQQELTKSNERFELIMKRGTESIWDFNPLTNELFLGEGFNRNFGINITSLDKNNDIINSRIHPNDFSAYIKDFKTALS